MMDLSLQYILFSITKLTGSTSAYLASKSEIFDVIQFLEPRIFNWSAVFLRNIKEHISKYGTGKHKQFWYGSFIVSFFLERVPQVTLIPRPATEFYMERWMSLSPRLGNEPSTFRFTTDFFAWLRRYLVVIEDFLYVGVEFRGSIDLVIPKGAKWDASGTKYHKLVTIYIYIYMFLVVR